MLGQTLGNFRIIEKMGEGGMGQLYLAQHVSMDRQAVVKVLRSHLVEDESVVRRFLNEANAAAMIGHPGIVYVMDVGRLPTGSPYMLMEYLEGQNLARRLELAGGALDVRTALSITRQIADALAAAHDKGIVHRDLKPGNIFLTRDTSVPGGERVKILDFGIAKLLAQSHDALATHTDIILGTPLYMSPEQCDGARTVDHRSDFYSLGVILFELVCGQTPFEPAGAGTLIAAHLMMEPPAPRSIVPSLPLDLEALILRLLAKMPAERPQDAHELIAAIDTMAGQWSGSWAALDPASISAVHRAVLPPALPAQLDRVEPARTRPSLALPAPVSPDMPMAYPSFTAQLGAGESMLLPTLQPSRRRLWAVLAGMSGVLIAVIVAWPWLQGDSRPAARPTARPAEPATTPAASPADDAPADAPSRPVAVATPGPSAPPASPAPAPPVVVAGRLAPATPAPATIEVEIASRPGQAEVFRNGTRLGLTPFRDTFPPSAKALVFVIKKPGYEDRVVEIRADRDRAQVVELQRKRVRRPAVRPPPRNKLRPEEGGPVDPF
jgi:serine/threonine protein kinase